jgi:hypothetical protein
MTAYRQQALACAATLSLAPSRPRDLKGDIPDAAKTLQRNVYGWFVRVERGLYGLSDVGSPHSYDGRNTFPLRTMPRR